MAENVKTNTYMDGDGDIIVCKLCQKWLSKPKCLPCMHSFCESCLTAYVKENTPDENDRDIPFNCPSCDNQVPIPDLITTKESWIKMLPTNRLLMTVIEKMSLDRAKNCDPCLRGDKKIEATSWCRECGEALCSPCTAYHKRVKILMEHSVFPLEDMYNQPQKMADTDEICPIHTVKKIEAICVDHDILCCVDCVTYEHDTCKTVLPITDAVQDVKNSQYLRSVLEKMKTIDNHVQSVITDYTVNVEELGEQKHRFFESIASTRENIVKYLNTMESSMHKDFDVMHSALIEELQNQKGKFEFLQNAMKNGQNVINASILYGTNEQIFVTIHKLKKLSENHEQYLKNKSSQINYYKYDTKLHDVIENFRDNVTELGYVSITKEPTNTIPTFTKHMVAVDLGDLNGRTSSDPAHSWFTSGIFLPNGSLVLVDYRNKKLKSFNIMNDLVCEVPFINPPWGVVQTEENELIVTTPDVPEMSVVKMENQTEMSLSSEKIPATIGCHGIHYSKGVFVIACSSYISIMTRDGDTQRVIRLTDRGTRYAQLDCRWRICYTNKTSLVCGGENHDTLFTYSDKSLRSPRGFAVDSEGIFYVCGMDSNNVHQIAQDGSRIKLLLDQNNDIKNPYAIGFEPSTTRFFVTQMDCDIVKLFRLITQW